MSENLADQLLEALAHRVDTIRQIDAERRRLTACRDDESDTIAQLKRALAELIPDGGSIDGHGIAVWRRGDLAFHATIVPPLKRPDVANAGQQDGPPSFVRLETRKAELLATYSPLVGDFSLPPLSTSTSRTENEQPVAAEAVCGE